MERVPLSGDVLFNALQQLQKRNSLEEQKSGSNCVPILPKPPETISSGDQPFRIRMIPDIPDNDQRETNVDEQEQNCSDIGEYDLVCVKDTGECPRLWRFIYQLLMDEKWSQIVCWECTDELTFRITNPKSLAEAWGKQKNRSNMTYEKLARALRYYYTSNIIRKVPEKPLTYQFLQHPSKIKMSKRGVKPRLSQDLTVEVEQECTPDSSTRLPTPSALSSHTPHSKSSSTYSGSAPSSQSSSTYSGSAPSSQSSSNYSGSAPSSQSSSKYSGSAPNNQSSSNYSGSAPSSQSSSNYSGSAPSSQSSSKYSGSAPSSQSSSNYSGSAPNSQSSSNYSGSAPSSQSSSNYSGNAPSSQSSSNYSGSAPSSQSSSNYSGSAPSTQSSSNYSGSAPSSQSSSNYSGSAPSSHSRSNYSGSAPSSQEQPENNNLLTNTQHRNHSLDQQSNEDMVYQSHVNDNVQCYYYNHQTPSDRCRSDYHNFTLSNKCRSNNDNLTASHRYDDHNLTPSNKYRSNDENLTPSNKCRCNDDNLTLSHRYDDHNLTPSNKYRCNDENLTPSNKYRSNDGNLTASHRYRYDCHNLTPSDRGISDDGNDTPTDRNRYDNPNYTIPNRGKCCNQSYYSQSVINYHMTHHKQTEEFTQNLGNICNSFPHSSANGPSYRPQNLIRNSSLLSHTGSHSPLLSHTGSHSPLLSHTGSHSPLLSHTGSQSPLLSHTGSHSPLLSHIGSHSPLLSHTGSHSPLLLHSDENSQILDNSFQIRPTPSDQNFPHRIFDHTTPPRNGVGNQYSSIRSIDYHHQYERNLDGLSCSYRYEPRVAYGDQNTHCVDGAFYAFLPIQFKSFDDEPQCFPEDLSVKSRSTRMVY